MMSSMVGVSQIVRLAQLATPAAQSSKIREQFVPKAITARVVPVTRPILAQLALMETLRRVSETLTNASRAHQATTALKAQALQHPLLRGTTRPCQACQASMHFTSVLRSTIALTRA